MNIGIPFEEKALEKFTIDEYLNKLKELSIAFVEVSLNFDNYSIEFYDNILNLLIKNNIKIHYHLPHFYDGNLDLTNFSENNNALNLFLLKLKKTHPKTQHSTLVVHGAKYESIDRSAAYTKTIDGLKYLLDFFETNNLMIDIALETLNGKKHKVIGDSREEILNLIHTIDSPRLNICWDITHDFLNLKEFIKPKKGFLNKITHLHIHGVNEKDHLAINKSHITFDKQLRYINKYLKNIPLTIEILTFDHYFEDISDSINSIRNIKTVNLTNK